MKVKPADLCSAFHFKLIEQNSVMFFKVLENSGSEISLDRLDLQI
jgi:hypothetical protein